MSPTNNSPEVSESSQINSQHLGISETRDTPFNVLIEWQQLKQGMDESQHLAKSNRESIKNLLKQCRLLGRYFPDEESRRLLQSTAAEMAEILLWQGDEDFPESTILPADRSNHLYRRKSLLGKQSRIKKVNINNLVQGGSVPVGKLLFGRDDELKQLDNAWLNQDTHVLSIEAMGGVGKSALVNYWLTNLERRDYRVGKNQVEYVFGWSFYSGGTGSHRAGGVDKFFEEALNFFQDKSSHDKKSHIDLEKQGERLANLLFDKKAILVLDGLEPLQYPPSPAKRAKTGRIKYVPVASLVKNLALKNRGLCIITTRLQVEDLNEIKEPFSKRLLLRNLSPEAGSDLLRRFELVGTDNDFKMASKAVYGHSLTLTILGASLQNSQHRQVKRWREIDFLKGKDSNLSNRAREVISYYEKSFGFTKKLSPEISLLRLLGLFDRPAQMGAIYALIREPAIFQLTDPLVDVDYAILPKVIHRLNQSGLLIVYTPEEGGEHESKTLDIHPLIREYFTEKIRRNKIAWQEGHSRLYDFFKSCEPFLPQTIQEAIPLYQSVRHACQAGMCQEAFDEIFIPRIHQGGRQYSWYKLATFGEEVETLSYFYKKPWTKFLDNLSEDTQAYLESSVGFCLRALGRLRDAESPLKSSMASYTELSRWKDAAITAGILSEQALAVGDLGKALKHARKGVELATRANDLAQIKSKTSKLADVLHQKGKFHEASEEFIKAEEVQALYDSERPMLYTRSGYLYCDFLLSQVEMLGLGVINPTDIAWSNGDLGLVNVPGADYVYHDHSSENNHILARINGVIKRLDITSDWLEEGSEPLIELGLGKLALGRAWLLFSAFSKVEDFSNSEKHLLTAEEYLRAAGQQQELPRVLIALSNLRRNQGKLSEAVRFLDEALTITSQGGMKRFSADCYIEYTKLFLLDEDRKNTLDSFHAANSLVKDIGYARRYKELEVIKASINEKS